MLYIVSGHGGRFEIKSVLYNANKNAPSPVGSLTVSEPPDLVVPAGFSLVFYSADGMELSHDDALKLYGELTTGKPPSLAASETINEGGKHTTIFATTCPNTRPRTMLSGCMILPVRLRHRHRRHRRHRPSSRFLR